MIRSDADFWADASCNRGCGIGKGNLYQRNYDSTISVLIGLQRLRHGRLRERETLPQRKGPEDV